MAKAKKNQVESTTLATDASVPSTDAPSPSVALPISLEQKIANRLGYGILIAAEMLKTADRASIEECIDQINNDELAARLLPENKA